MTRKSLFIDQRADDGFNFVGFRFTRNTWTVPPESITRFQETVTALLKKECRRTLADVAKSHNNYVRIRQRPAQMKPSPVLR